MFTSWNSNPQENSLYKQILVWIPQVNIYFNFLEYCLYWLSFILKLQLRFRGQGLFFILCILKKYCLYQSIPTNISNVSHLVCCKSAILKEDNKLFFILLKFHLDLEDNSEEIGPGDKIGFTSCILLYLYSSNKLLNLHFFSLSKSDC